MPSDDGIMVILSSPSGAGKTTLIKLLSEQKIISKLKIDLNLRPQNLDFDTYYKLTTEYEKLGS